MALVGVAGPPVGVQHGSHMLNLRAFWKGVGLAWRNESKVGKVLEYGVLLAIWARG